MAAVTNRGDGTPVRRAFYCTSCGSVFKEQQGNFYHAGSPLYKGNGGYLSVCMKCVDDIFDKYLSKFNGDEEAACRRTCSKLDLYFNPGAFDSAPKVPKRSKMGNYMAKLVSDKSYAKSFDDTIFEMSMAGASDGAEYGGEPDPELEGVPDTVVQFWGDGFSKKQYDELQSCYDRWTQGKTLAGADEIGLYRQIAIADWQVFNAARRGAKTEQLQQVLNSLLSKTSVSEKRASSEDSRSVGEKIRDWERERPIPEASDEFRDVDGIVRYITIWFLGHFCKMFGIKNSYNKMYEEEMAKYRVERPEYIESDDDENVFDAIFGSKRGGDG